MFSWVMGSPYRFFLAAAVLAAILCLYPARVEEQSEPAQSASDRQETRISRDEAESLPPASPVQRDEMAGADLSARTQKGCYLHSTLHYAPCGHSVQRRESLPAQLVGLSRAALESQIAGVIPGASVTGFSAAEVDISVSKDIPCPLHWVLRVGEDGMLGVWQNMDGEALSLVRRTEIPLSLAEEQQRAQLLEGMVFDDVQALESVLESLSS